LGKYLEKIISVWGLACLLLISLIARADEPCQQLLNLSAIKHSQTQYAKHYDSSPAAWSSYFDNTKEDSTPHASLIFALDYLAEHELKPSLAVDIGAGTGRDTLYLLAHNVQTLAIDFSPKALAIIQSRAHAEHLPLPQIQVSDFLTMQLPEQIDLINSYLALPFAKPENFIQIWGKIFNHLRPGGLFAGSLLDENDDYAGIPDTTTLSAEQLHCLMQPYEILYLKKVVLDSKVTGKHWEIWEFVLKKPFI